MSRGLLKSVRGSLIAEFALTVPLFLVVMFTGIETVRLSYSNVAAQIVADRGIEMARSRPCCSNNQTAQAIANDIRVELNKTAKGLGISNSPTICITPQANASNCLTDPSAAVSVAGPRELFVVRVHYRINFLFGLSHGFIDAFGVGRHEPNKM